MAFGLPHISFIGHPVELPCAAHAGLGFRRARQGDSAATIEHLGGLTMDDRRHRFCATLTDESIARHVDGLWSEDRIVIAAFDGPLWAGPLLKTGPVRALVDVTFGNGFAELGLTVDSSLRRRGVGTYLVQAVARLLRPKGITRIDAITLPGNTSFITLAAKAGARIDRGPDQVDIAFDCDALSRAYRRRRWGELQRLPLAA